MIEGVFKLSFEVDQDPMGSGLATFKKGKITGGNSEFLYFGNYELNEIDLNSSTNFDAEVTAQYYKGINLAIFGNLTRFTVKLAGVSTGDTLSAFSKNKKNKNDKITLKGIKIDDFDDELSIKNLIFNDSLNSMPSESLHLLQTTTSLYAEGKYIDVTNIFISLIDSVIDRLLLTIAAKSEAELDFLGKLSILVEKDIISKKLSCILTELNANDKILNKKSNSPNDCAFPLCILAFNSLAKLWSLDYSHPVIGIM